MLIERLRYMKTLIIFMDMLRTDFLNTYSKKAQKSVIDEFFLSFGGTTYTNIYTPCPDTGRSLASFWSMNPCYLTDCNKRGKYPKQFLNNSTFLDVLEGDHVNINLYSHHRENIFPHQFDGEKYKIHSLSYSQYSGERSLTFIDLPDVHHVLDDFGYTIRGVQKAHIQLLDSLNFLFSNIDKDQFDTIVFFSDHGHLLNIERGTKINFLDYRRSRIFLHIYNKGDNKHSNSNVFNSITIIGKKILELYSSDNNINKLEINDEIDWLLIEDFFGITTGINQIPDIWNIKTNSSDNQLDLNGIYTNKRDFFSLIAKYNLFTEYPHFKTLISEHSVFLSYGKPIKSYPPYFNGKVRKKHYQPRLILGKISKPILPPILFSIFKKIFHRLI